MAEQRLDVRDVDEPFDVIMEELAELGRDDSLVLVNSFEPEPLYNVLEDEGFTHETRNEDGVWFVRIQHT